MQAKVEDTLMRKRTDETVEQYKSRYRIYMKSWRSKNKERELNRQRDYRKNNLHQIRDYRRKWTEKNREKVREYMKKYFDSNRSSRKEYAKLWARKQQETDSNYRIKGCLRQRIYTALKRRGLRKRPSLKTMELVGCTIEFLAGYLQGLFKDGMTWENQGKWHIDHKIPLAEFDLRDESQQKLAFHYSNLQPLWGKDNMSKGSKRLSIYGRNN